MMVKTYVEIASDTSKVDAPCIQVLRIQNLQAEQPEYSIDDDYCEFMYLNRVHIVIIRSTGTLDYG